MCSAFAIPIGSTSAPSNVGVSSVLKSISLQNRQFPKGLHCEALIFGIQKGRTLAQCVELARR
jgi:hypothetical protein